MDDIAPTQVEQPSQPPPDEVSPAGVTPFLSWIVALRWVFFALVGLLLVVGYNGRWRIGRDSSLYREVARNLAAGRGYTFRGEHERHIYPGLPFMLAGIDRVFGPQDPLRPQAAILVMLGIAVATLVTVYHLVRTCYPRWMAVCVTTGVGINQDFLRQPYNLMSDLPFLLGVCLTLLGLARLGQNHSSRRGVRWLLVAGVGTVLAISMRPTFWALALAWAGACVVGVLRWPRRWRYLLAFAALVAMLLVWWKIDPRLSGSTGIFGKYERIALAHVSTIGSAEWWKMLNYTLDEHLPTAMFGFEMRWHLGKITFAVLLLGSLLLMRRSVLWGLYVLVTLGMTVVVGSVPRYFLMILPLLLTAWAIVTEIVARWFAVLKDLPSERSPRWLRPLAAVSRRWPYMPTLAVLWGLGLPTVVNVVHCLDFLREQHGFTRDLKRRTFLEVYRDGKMLPLVRLSELISRHVPPGEKVLGPEPRITTYLSGRDVFHVSDFPDYRNLQRWRTIPWKAHLTWCVYGPEFSGEKLIHRLIRDRYIAIAPRSVVSCDNMHLGRIIKPRKKPAAPAATQPATRPVRAATTRPVATRPVTSRLAASRPARAAAAGTTRPRPPATRPSALLLWRLAGVPEGRAGAREAGICS